MTFTSMLSTSSSMDEVGSTGDGPAGLSSTVHEDIMAPQVRMAANRSENCLENFFIVVIFIALYLIIFL